MKGLRKIPLREMARKLSISPSYLCDIENGRYKPREKKVDNGQGTLF